VAQSLVAVEEQVTLRAAQELTAVETVARLQAKEPQVQPTLVAVVAVAHIGVVALVQ
jgi:hypothetical protein